MRLELILRRDGGRQRRRHDKHRQFTIDDAIALPAAAMKSFADEASYRRPMKKHYRERPHTISLRYDYFYKSLPLYDDFLTPARRGLRRQSYLAAPSASI